MTRELALLSGYPFLDNLNLLLADLGGALRALLRCALPFPFPLAFSVGSGRTLKGGCLGGDLGLYRGAEGGAVGRDVAEHLLLRWGRLPVELLALGARIRPLLLSEAERIGGGRDMAASQRGVGDIGIVGEGDSPGRHSRERRRRHGKGYSCHKIVSLSGRHSHTIAGEQ
jgi:hypothetical protein